RPSRTGTAVSFRSVLFRQISVINGTNGPSLDLFDIAAGANPFRPQRQQTARNIDIYIWITPWTTRIVNAHRLVDIDPTVHRLRRRKRDFAERHFDLGMQFAGDINFARVRQWFFDRMNRIWRIRV